jgi:hypothetical protein
MHLIGADRGLPSGSAEDHAGYLSLNYCSPSFRVLGQLIIPSVRIADFAHALQRYFEQGFFLRKFLHNFRNNLIKTRE